jgi:hypothetical protein
MTRNQAKLYVVGGLLLAAGGFAVSGPSVPNFWLWMAMPTIMVVGGGIRLMRK